MATIDLRVEGMACDGCVRSVTKKLSGIAGVERADVDLGSARAKVDYDDARATPEQMIAAVEQIGFKAARE